MAQRQGGINPLITAVFQPSFCESPFGVLRFWRKCYQVAWLGAAPHRDAQSYQFNTVQIDGNERIATAPFLSCWNRARGRAIRRGELTNAMQEGLFESVGHRNLGAEHLVTTGVEFPTIQPHQL